MSKYRVDFWKIMARTRRTQTEYNINADGVAETGVRTQAAKKYKKFKLVKGNGTAWQADDYNPNWKNSGATPNPRSAINVSGFMKNAGKSRYFKNKKLRQGKRKNRKKKEYKKKSRKR
jgi:hypothetical protein